MSLPRLRLETSRLINGVWHISPEEAHHLVKVRRCYTGSLVEGLLNGERLELKLHCDDDYVTATELSREAEPPPSQEVHLLLALLKSDQFVTSLRFAAEIGVTGIHLLECERCVPKYSGERTKDKLTRWRKVLDEATKQAGSARAPSMEAPVTLNRLDYSSLPSHKYVALLSDEAVALNKIKINYPAVVAIGPEGDWSPTETRLLFEKGFKPISLGQSILRASTAVAVVSSYFMLGRDL